MQYSNPHNYLHTVKHLSRDGFVPSTSAGTFFAITNDYVTRLCRQKKIEGVLLGRLWFVNKKSLECYLQQTRLKRQEQRHLLSQQLSREYQQHFAAAKPL